MSSQRRLLILAEGFSDDAHYGKTARGVLRYRPEEVVAILDSKRAGKTHEGGFPIVGTVFGALAYEPNTALVGVATQGGRFPAAWRDLLKECITKGLDIENGLHEFITDDPELSELAALHGVQLRDLRKPPSGLNVPTGENLTHDSKVVLTVGSDCAIGKMTVALELDAETRRRGIKSEFVPTGQTGIAIAGWGISVDAVVADFLAGSAETLVIEGAQPRRGAAVGRGPGIAAPSRLLRRHARPPSRQCPTRARALPPGRAGDRRRRRPLPDALACLAGRAVRALVADRAARQGGRDRAQHPKR